MLESAYQTAADFFGELLGENGLRYIPYLLSVLVYIAAANLIGILGMKPSTKDLGVTAGLAILSILLVEFAGIRQKGVKGWLKGFAEPLPLVAPINLWRYLQDHYHCVCVCLEMSLEHLLSWNF